MRERCAKVSSINRAMSARLRGINVFAATAEEFDRFFIRGVC